MALRGIVPTYTSSLLPACSVDCESREAINSPLGEGEVVINELML